MQRILALTLAFVMCFSLFACENEEVKTTVEEVKTTVEEAKTTVEEVKKLTLDDIKAMSILELAKLELEDVKPLSAAELKIASQNFEEKKPNTTEEELKEYINEFYLKENPELAPLAEDVVKIFSVLKERSSQGSVSEESRNFMLEVKDNYLNGYYSSYDDNVLNEVIRSAAMWFHCNIYGEYLGAIIGPGFSERDKLPAFDCEDFNASKEGARIAEKIIETPIFFTK